MKHPNGDYYEEVKDKRSLIHPNEKKILRLREEPKTLRTQCPVQNNTEIRENQKVNENISVN